MADWIVAQRKTFLRWANSHLKRIGKEIDSIETGFKNGKLLCKLIALLTSDKVPFPNKKCKMEIHCLENINAALKYLTDKKGIRLVGIGTKDVYDGSEKLILGLLWTIILRLEISEFSIDGIAGKKGLLMWCQRVTNGYPKCGKKIKNFSRSWANGLGFCAIIHHFRPDCLDFDSLDQNDGRACCETAIAAATALGIPELLEVSDLVDVPKPDEKVVMTYCAEFFKKFAASEAAEAKVKAIKEAVGLTMHHEKLLEEYNSSAAEFGDWVDGEMVTVESMEPGVSVEELEEQQKEFGEYLLNEKPKRQQDLLKVQNTLLSLQSSQRNNGRPIQEISDENVAPAELSRKWESLCQMQSDLDRLISQRKNQYHQFSFMVTNFDAKAAAVDQWADDTQNNLESVAAEIDDSTANGLSQKISAYSRYSEQVERYDGIMKDLKGIIEEVQEPYVDAARIAGRFSELEEKLQELSEYAGSYHKSATESLAQVEAVQQLVKDYCKTAENFAFEADTLTTRIQDQRAGDTEAVCEEQLESNNEASSTIERLDNDYAALTGQAEQLDETGNSAEIPPNLTLDILEDKLNALKKLLQEKTAAVEEARDEARRKNETRIETLKQEHDQATTDYAEQVTALQAWINEQSARFQHTDRAHFGTTTRDVGDKAESLSEYRDGDKPIHLSKLYDLESRLGALRTSQSQNQLPVFEPSDDQSTQALKDAWAGLEEAEVTYEQALQKCYVDYRAMKRSSASCNTKVEMVNTWVDNQVAIFADTSEPDGQTNRVDELESRLGQFRKYKKQASRYDPVVDQIGQLAESVEEPYHTKATVDSAAQEVRDAVAELARIAEEFAATTQEQLDTEKQLLGKAKEYKDIAEDLLFALDEEQQRIDDMNLESPKRASASAQDLAQSLAEHTERGSMLEKEINDSQPNLQSLSDQLSNAGRTEYIPADMTVDRINEQVDAVQKARVESGADIQSKLDAAENEGSSAVQQLQQAHTKQMNEFEAAAVAIKEWIASKKQSFVEDRAWTSVNQCSAAVSALTDYRTNEKPTKQGELFGLEGRIGRLTSSQRQNNMKEYLPRPDLTPASLISAWENLQSGEVEYEAELLHTLDAYTKMQGAYEEFNSTSTLISNWADEKQAIFDASVDVAESFQSPADVLTSVHARLQSYSVYSDQWNRYKPLKIDVVDVLITKIEDPYEHASDAAAAHAALDAKLQALSNAAEEFLSTNEAACAQQQIDLDLSQKHAHKADGTLFQLRLVRDDLTTPVNEASVTACEDAIASVAEITNSKLDAIRNEVDDELRPMYDELKAKPNAEERMLLQDAHDNNSLKQQVESLAELAEEQASRLQAALGAAREKETAAKAFGEAANAFASYIKTQHSALSQLDGSPEERKNAIIDIQTDVSNHSSDLEECRTLDEDCKAKGVTSNNFTTETQYSIESLFEGLQKLVAKMLNDIEGQLAAATAGKLDPETVKSLNKLFKEFNTDGDGLGFQEFYECCNACGLVIDEKQAKKLFGPYETESGGKISWDEFAQLMENEMGSGTTLEDVTSSFRDLAEGAATIPEQTLNEHFGNSPPIHAYIGDHMVDGDYSKFANELFSH